MKILFLFLIFTFTSLNVFAEKCKGNSKQNWNNCFGTSNSWYGTYIGYFKDGKKDGKGTIHFYNGDTFVGEFRQDKKHGPGKFTYSSGETSSGIWEDDLFIGK